MLNQLAQRFEYLASIYNSLDTSATAKNDNDPSARRRFETLGMEMAALDDAILYAAPGNMDECFFLLAVLDGELSGLLDDLRITGNWSDQRRAAGIETALTSAISFLAAQGHGVTAYPHTTDFKVGVSLRQSKDRYANPELVGGA